MNTKRIVFAAAGIVVLVGVYFSYQLWQRSDSTENPRGSKSGITNASPDSVIPDSKTADGGKDRKIAATPYLFRRAVALVVGIDAYKRIDGVKFAVRDAEKVGEAFRDLYGFESHYLLGKDATREKIREAIDRFAKAKHPDGTDNPNALGKDDAFVLFFAGHGNVINVEIKPNNVVGREGFLVPYDADLSFGIDQNLDRWRKQAISMRDTLDQIEEMQAGHALVIADCCCSGFMARRGAPVQYRNDIRQRLLGRSRGVLAATTSVQEARWDETLQHGVFTAALLEELRRWSDIKEPASLADLFSGIQKRVENHAKGKDMLPQMNPRFGDGDGEFVLLPKSLRETDMRQLVENLKNAKDTRIPHPIFTDLSAREAERANRKTQLADLIEAFESTDYHFAIDADVKDRYWREKFKLYQTNAANGDVLAMAALHYCHSRGFGTAKNDEAALRWAQSAFETDDPAGIHVMARCLLNGVILEKNQPAAMAMFEKAANRKFPISQYVIGNSLLSRIPAPDREEIAQAEILLRHAASFGVASANYSLAMQLLARRIPEGRESEGLALLKRAAEQNLASAHHGVYEVYVNQQPGGPQPDRELAKTHLVQAAKLGNPFSQRVLATNYYREGPYLPTLDFPKDYEKARFWALLVSQSLDPRDSGYCHGLLAHYYENGHGVSKDTEKALFHLEEGVRRNCPYTQYFLGSRLLVHDSGYERNPEKAFLLAKKSAAQGNVNGHYLLGHIYHIWVDPITAKVIGRKPLDYEYYGWSHHILYNYFKAHVKGHRHEDILKYFNSFKEWLNFERENGPTAFLNMKSANKLPSFVLQRLIEEYPETALTFRQTFGISIPGSIKLSQAKPIDGIRHIVPKEGLKIDGRIDESDQNDTVRGTPVKVFFVKLENSKTYTIDMESGQLDSFLRVEDEDGKQIAFDDDSGGFPNARIVLRPKADGIYRFSPQRSTGKPEILR